MSYILDALRRADAERERGGVPGLHAQSQAGAAGDDPSRRHGLPWAGIAVALGLSLLVVLLWLVFAPAGAPTVPAAPPALPAAPLPVPTAPTAAAEPPAPAPAPAAAPAPGPAVQPPQQPALPPPVPVPVARAPSPAAATATAAAKPASLAAHPASALASAAAEARVPALRELPEELRRQIPNLVIGGSTWSENAASRFVILNGQLLRENDTVAPELTLRQIRPRAVVLEFRGQRFELAY